MNTLKDYITSFADRQTQERIRQCNDLERALNECERIRRIVDTSKTASDTIPKFRIQDSRVGMKISRFYGWGLVNHRAEEKIAEMRGDGGMRSMYPSKNEMVEDPIKNRSTSIPKTNATNSSISCSREHHAVWGCRAIALGCSSELVQLKKCFQDRGDINPHYFTYKNDGTLENTDENGCQLDMQKLGKCVTKNFEDLNNRMS